MVCVMPEGHKNLMKQRGSQPIICEVELIELPLQVDLFKDFFVINMLNSHVYVY